MHKSFYLIISVSILSIFSGCNKPGQQIHSPTPPAPVQMQALTEAKKFVDQTPLPTVSNVNQSAIPTPPMVEGMLTGENWDQTRQMIKLVIPDMRVLPEDYKAGPVLFVLPEDQDEAPKAIDFIQDFFSNMRSGTIPEDSCTVESFSFIKLLLDRYKEQFALIRMVRFQKMYRMTPEEAAFSLSLISINGHSRAEIYLSRKTPTDKWQVNDLQGDLSPLSEKGQSGYTDYMPQDIERQLIREGHERPWQ